MLLNSWMNINLHCYLIVDSHVRFTSLWRIVVELSTGTGKRSPAPKRNYVLTSTAYIEIDTVSTPSYHIWWKQMANFISSVAPPYETMIVHFFLCMSIVTWQVKCLMLGFSRASARKCAVPFSALFSSKMFSWNEAKSVFFWLNFFLWDEDTFNSSSGSSSLSVSALYDSVWSSESWVRTFRRNSPLLSGGSLLRIAFVSPLSLMGTHCCRFTKIRGNVEKKLTHSRPWTTAPAAVHAETRIYSGQYIDHAMSRSAATRTTWCEYSAHPAV